MSLGLVTIPKLQDFCMNALLKECRSKQWHRIDSCRAQVSQPTDSQGKSLLMRAIELKDDRMTEEFVYRGISLSIKDKSGNTALHYAAESGVSEYIALLLPHCAIDEKNTSDQTPFDLAKSAKKANVFVKSILSKAHCCLKSQGAPLPIPWLEALFPILEKNYGAQHKTVGLCLELLGQSYYLQFEYVKALEAIEKAQKILGQDRLSKVSLSMMADCYYETGGYDKAIGIFKWLFHIGFQTNKLKFLFRIGDCYEKLGMDDKAEEYFEEAKKLHKQELRDHWANGRGCL